MKRTGLKRKSPMKRCAMKVGRTHGDPPELVAAKQVVYERSGGRCEIRKPGVCKGRASHVHHTMGRGFPGCHHPDLLLDTCAGVPNGCHEWAHAHPKESYLYGWMRKRTSGHHPVS